MNHLLKSAAKIAVGTCFALGAVAVAASAVAGSNIGKVVAAGIKGAKEAVDAELDTLKAGTASAEESAMFADVKETSSVEVEATPADFEN